MSKPMGLQYERWAALQKHPESHIDDERYSETEMEKLLQQCLINTLSPKQALISLCLDRFPIKIETLLSISKHFPRLQKLSLRGCPILVPLEKHVAILEALTSFPELRRLKVGSLNSEALDFRVAKVYNRFGKLHNPSGVIFTIKKLQNCKQEKIWFKFWVKDIA